MPKKKTTTEEKRYYAKVAALGCIVCRNLGYYDTPPEIHHVRFSAGAGQKSKKVIPLCHTHHRTGGYGVAFHAGKKAFEYNFGTEQGLLAQVEDLIDGV